MNLLPKLIIGSTPLTSAKKGYNLLGDIISWCGKHFILFLILIALLALCAKLYGSFADKMSLKHQAHKEKRHEQKQQKKDTRALINQIQKILGLIDQRMSIDGNPDELSRLRDGYQQLENELSSGIPIDIPADQLLYEYYTAYNDDHASQLSLEMQYLARMMGYTV